MHGHMNVKDQWHISSQIWNSRSGDVEDSFFKTWNTRIHFLKNVIFTCIIWIVLIIKMKYTHLFFFAAIILYCGTG